MKKVSDPTILLVLDTISIGKQAIVFANTKRSAEKAAEDISKQIKNVSLDELADKVLHVLSKPTKQCERLSVCIKKGVAFHHAGLRAEQKDLIEENFKKGVVKIICCTPTLAYGLDLPAFRVILKDLRRYGHRGLAWIPVLEYLQMAGRAGRPSYDKEGQAIAIAASEDVKDEIWNRYIEGVPEEIYSKLAVEPVLRMYLLSLIASGFVKDRKSIISFFEKTFWAFQFKDMAKLEGVIDKVLGQLEEWEFIKSNSEDFQSADSLDNGRIAATLIGKRVSELYLDPLTAHHLIECLKIGHKEKITEAFSYLQMLSHTLEIRPLLNVRTKEYDDIQNEILKYHDLMLEPEPSFYDLEYDDYLNSVKTALFFLDWISEKDEEFLLEKYNVRPGEIRAKLTIIDWLVYGCEELARMLSLKEVIKELIKLRLRLKHGAKEELLPLLKFGGIGRVRARKLFNNGIKDVGDVKKTKFIALAQILGQKTAVSLKEQVGEKVAVVPKGTRKGQTSVMKY